ncbi:unnamed protein product [Coccothraustes coccothraustes]
MSAGRIVVRPLAGVPKPPEVADKCGRNTERLRSGAGAALRGVGYCFLWREQCRGETGDTTSRAVAAAPAVAVFRQHWSHVGSISPRQKRQCGLSHHWNKTAVAAPHGCSSLLLQRGEPELLALVLHRVGRGNGETQRGDSGKKSREEGENSVFYGGGGWKPGRRLSG